MSYYATTGSTTTIDISNKRQMMPCGHSLMCKESKCYNKDYCDVCEHWLDRYGCTSNKCREKKVLKRERKKSKK